uniref:Uncharacterized protein n=1 Tax=Anabas testudineus TaxID=64144 RepID=A0A7N6AWR0_ANATE
MLNVRAAFNFQLNFQLSCYARYYILCEAVFFFNLLWFVFDFYSFSFDLLLAAGLQQRTGLYQVSSFNIHQLEISKTHLNLESMRSSDKQYTLTNASMSVTFGGAKIVCTMNLCLLFSLGS